MDCKHPMQEAASIPIEHWIFLIAVASLQQHKQIPNRPESHTRLDPYYINL